MNEAFKRELSISQTRWLSAAEATGIFLKKPLLTLVFLLTTMLSFGQAQTLTAEERPYIEVTGTAEKEVIPDELYLRIVIRERYVQKTKITVEEQEEKLKAAIKAIGIQTENLYLTNANADYVKISRQKKDVLTRKDYTLKVNDAPTLGKVFQELEKLEITDAFIEKVSYSKMDELRKEVHIQAIQAAKEKADYLLQAIGEKTGKPLIIKEEDPAYGTHYNVRSNVVFDESSYGTYFGMVEGKNKEDLDDEIQFRKINVQISIYVKFAIQ